MDRPRPASSPRWLPLAALLALCGALGCADAGRAPRGVVATVPPLAWLASALLPPGETVPSLVPEGASPSAFEPGFREIRALDRAALWVRVGHPHFPFERAQLDPLAAERGDLRIVSVFVEDEPASEDPHVWLDPAQMAGTIDRLAAALAALLPGEAAAVEVRRAALHEEVAALDVELSDTLRPFAGRPFVVQHPAFSHLARAYRLEQLAVEAEHREPSGPQLAALIRRARAAGVETVFVQPQFDRAAATLVADALDARVATLDPLASDWPAGLRRAAQALAASFAR